MKGKELEKADLIIHAGDWQTLRVFYKFTSFGKVVGVYRNVDGLELMEILPDKQILEVNRFRIGIVQKEPTQLFYWDNASWK